MRAVVIGGTGFLGGAIADELVRRGHDTAAVSPSAPPIGSGLLHLHAGDLARPAGFAHLLDTADVVILAAGRSVPGNARGAAVAELHAQVEGTLSIIDHLAARAPRAQLVYLSSAGGLAPGDVVFDEADRPQPWSTYGALKLAVESFIDARDHELGRRSLLIRPSNPYGPGQRLDKPQGFIAKACAAAVAGEPIELWDDPATRRDWLYIEDFASCVVSSIEAGVTGPLHVAAGREHSLAEVLEIIGGLAGAPPELVLAVRDGRAAPPSLAISNRLAVSVLRWQPTVSLDEGIARLWRHLTGERSTTASLAVHDLVRP